MMKKSKLLININNLEEIEKYEKIGIVNFLFAIDKLSIGYKTFKLEDIPDNAYILINRVLDTEGIDYLKSIISELTRFKGIIFEDIGAYNVLKDTNIPIIWFQNHFGTNRDSINFYLNHGCTSAVISNEITKEEIINIVASATKPLVLNIFGKNNVMYSRRHLLSNFNKYNHLESYNDMVLDTGKNKFFAHESEYGTAIFDNDYFNYFDFTSSLDESKIFFFLILNLDLDIDKMISIIDGEKIGGQGFLDKKTVYKMSEYNDKR